MKKLSELYKQTLSQVLAEVEARVLMGFYNKDELWIIERVDDVCYLVNHEVEDRIGVEKKQERNIK